MLDKNVGDALLKLDLTPQTDPPAAQIERIIEADQAGVKRWTRISIVLWILAAVGAFLIFVMGGLWFPAIAATVMEDNARTAAAVAEGGHAGSPAGTLENPDTPFLMLAKLIAMTMVSGCAAFFVLVLAGLATVLLLLRSRSATLRQINANLLQISEHLKRMPPGGTTSPMTTGS